MPWLYQLTGSALILLALADIFLTVLYARSGTGLLSPRIHQHVWRFMVRMVRGRSERARGLLSYAGPTMMLLSVAAWIALLWLGSALIVWPLLGHSVQASESQTATDFVTALYFAGYSLTTVGVGDLVPQSAGMKLFTVLMGLIGFSVVTLTITYFMSVYSALIRRNVISQTLHWMSGGSADPFRIVAGLGVGGSFSNSSSEVNTIGRGLLEIVEAHEAYPVLQYFRMKDVRYGIARVTLLSLETATIIKASLSAPHNDFRRSAAVNLLWSSGLELLQDVEGSFTWSARSEDPYPNEDEGLLRGRFQHGLEQLEAHGIGVRTDARQAFADYAELRCQWVQRVQTLARCTGFGWEAVAGADATSDTN